MTLLGASKGTRVGWARCSGAFSRGVSSDEDGTQDTPDAAAAGVPKLGYGSDSWGICGHKQGKSYHQAGRVRADRVEAAAKARRDQRKEEGGDDDDDDEEEEEDDDGEEAGGKGRSGEGGSSDGTFSEGDGEAAEDDHEEDTADSIFLALGGLFRDTSFTVDQEGEDGGNPIEYMPAAAAAAAATAAAAAAAPSSPSIPLPPPPISSGLNPVQAPSTPPDRTGAANSPPPPPPPPPPLPLTTPSRSAGGMKLPRPSLSREADSPLRPWGSGAVIGCLADLVAADGDGDGDGDGAAGEGKPGEVKLHFFLNGRPVNGNASVPIFSATAAESEADWALCPAFSCASSSDGVSINLGDTPFQFPPDGLIATLGSSPTEGGGSGGGPAAAAAAAAAAASAAASPSSLTSSREKRSRYGSAAADRTPQAQALLGRAAERALEGAAFGLEQEGRASPSPASGGRSSGSGGGGEGRGVGSPHGGGGSSSSGSGVVVRTMAEARMLAEALRSPSKASGEAAADSAAAAAAAATGGKQGRTKGIIGGVLAVKDAAVSRCVRFDGHGWAVAQRPNLTVQALDVFLLEALIRPTAGAGAGRARREAGSKGEGEEQEQEQEQENESVVLSQGGASGFCLAIQGTKAILQLSGAEAAAGEQPRHVTPDGALPAAGSWFKLSAAVARDASQGMDKVGGCAIVCLPGLLRCLLTVRCHFTRSYDIIVRSSSDHR